MSTPCKIIKYITVVLCMASTMSAQAQSRYVVDSLKHTVASAMTDSARVTGLAELAIVHGIIDYTTALRYCDSAVAIAAGKKHRKLLCYVKCRQATLHRLGNDSTQFRKAIQLAEQLAVALKDSVLFGLVYHEQALYKNQRSSEYDGALSLLLKSADLLENSRYHKIMHLNHTTMGLIFQKANDFDKNLFYARKSLKYAKNVNDQAYSYHYIGTAYVNIGFRGPGFEYGIDSGLFFLKKAKTMVAHNKKRIKDVFLISAVSSLIARAYVNHNVKYVYNMDSAVFYLEETRKDALESHNWLNYTSACTILSKYYLDADNIKRAEHLLSEARRNYHRAITQSKSVEYNMYLGLSFLAEKKKDYGEAIAHLKRYHEIKDTLSNIQKLSSVRSIESKFMIDKKERQIKALEEQDYNRRKAIYFYFALAAVGVMLFVLLFRLNVFRSKFFAERQKVLEQQARYAYLKKEEAERALQVELEESKKLTIEKQLEVNRKEQYQKELMTSVLHLERKNGLVIKLKESIASFEQNAAEIKRVQKLIDENLDIDDDFGRFSKNFELLYPGFFKQLNEGAAGSLTQLDLRYCAYIYMGLSTEEMSKLLNVDPASIRKARYRLKQKLNLGKEDDLEAFIKEKSPVLGPPASGARHGL